MKILRVIDAVGEAIGRWRFRGQCATCRHFVSVVGLAAYRSSTGDGFCQNPASACHLVDVYRRTTCAQHEAVTP